MAVDWLPGKRADQLAMAKNWGGVMAANMAAWNLSTSVVMPLKSMAERAEEIFNKANGAERTATVGNARWLIPVFAGKRNTMASKTPHALEFTEEERGKTVYIALAWQNEHGLIGA
jgi:hypothetical protein